MKRYLIAFSYDATNYHGYQKQPHLKTVQQVMEDSLAKINNNQKVVLHASSRTDQGVHAMNQKAHFDFDVDISDYKLKRALNSNLPEDIHVNNVNGVDKNFHARFDAVKKEYQYLINTGEYNPIERNNVYQYGKDLDIGRMMEAIKSFEGTHDFTSFASAEDTKEDKVRTVFETSIDVNNQKITISFVGDGFLKYQVRNMVGTLIEVGNGKREPHEIKNILSSRDRRSAGKTAKPEGLYLMDVWYE